MSKERNGGEDGCSAPENVDPAQMMAQRRPRRAVQMGRQARVRQEQLEHDRDINQRTQGRRRQQQRQLHNDQIYRGRSTQASFIGLHNNQDQLAAFTSLQPDTPTPAGHAFEGNQEFDPQWIAILSNKGHSDQRRACRALPSLCSVHKEIRERFETYRQRLAHDNNIPRQAPSIYFSWTTSKPNHIRS